MKKISQLKQKVSKKSEENEKKKKERKKAEQDWIMVVWEGLQFPTWLKSLCHF